MPTLVAPPAPQATLDPAFQRKVFLLRQKLFKVSEKYVVWDEHEREILFVHRPAHLLRGILSLLAGFATAAVLFVIDTVLSTFLPESVRPIGMTLGVLACLCAGFAVAIRLSVKRHVGFYRDATRKERLLAIEQDRKFALLCATYTVKDPSGKILALLRKHYLHNLLRKRWTCHAPGGALISTIKEDSLFLSIARRLLGPMLGLLRTNFVLYDVDSERELGEFNRKFTLRDHYVLDMSKDRHDRIDPRVALAIGVMLDTGEGR